MMAVLVLEMDLVRKKDFVFGRERKSSGFKRRILFHFFFSNAITHIPVSRVSLMCDFPHLIVKIMQSQVRLFCSQTIRLY